MNDKTVTIVLSEYDLSLILAVYNNEADAIHDLITRLGELVIGREVPEDEEAISLLVRIDGEEHSIVMAI